MTQTAQARKSALREKLIALAEARIAAHGLAGLRARALASDAGCAVGALYTHFDDLAALVLAVNGRTAARLDAALLAAVDESRDLTPTERLIVTSYAYLGFAARNLHLWRALFDIPKPPASPVPDWQANRLSGLRSRFSEPITQIFPGLSGRELDLMCRAVVASVHGIVLLGLDGHAAGPDVDPVEEMLAQLLTRVG